MFQSNFAAARSAASLSTPSPRWRLARCTSQVCVEPKPRLFGSVLGANATRRVSPLAIVHTTCQVPRMLN